MPNMGASQQRERRGEEGHKVVLRNLGSGASMEGVLSRGITVRSRRQVRPGWAALQACEQISWARKRSGRGARRRQALMEVRQGAEMPN